MEPAVHSSSSKQRHAWLPGYIQVTGKISPTYLADRSSELQDQIVMLQADLLRGAAISGLTTPPLSSNSLGGLPLGECFYGCNDNNDEGSL